MKLLSRRLLCVVMITLLGCTIQVSDARKRIGFAHDAGKSPVLTRDHQGLMR